MKILIKNGLVVTANTTQQQDILIVDKNIEKISSKITAKVDQVIDATGKWILPGLVDVHVHFRDPGFTAKETVATGSQAAIHGGYTSVLTMPNVDPVPDTAALLTKMIATNQQNSNLKISQIAPLTKQRTSDELNDLSNLKKSGAVAFSNDGNGVQNSQVMFEAMQQVAKLNVPLAAHVEDESLMNHGVMNSGAVAKKLGLPGISDVTETAQLARDLELARVTGVHYHVCHISTRRSVELVRQAKAEGVNVTAEVTPHHLLLDETMIPGDNPAFKMNPPLRKTSDRQALIEGILDGTIDIVATDHAPHTELDKQGSMKTAAFGITGLETALPLLFTHFVKPGILTISQLVGLMSTRPAQLFNLVNAGQLNEAQPADLIIFDPSQSWTISTEDFKSKGHNSPFIGETVYGKNQLTMVNGQIVFSKE